MKQNLYKELLLHLTTNISNLTDKPEESAEATLKALWFAAYGDPKSAQLAFESKLPELDDNQVDKLSTFVERRIRGIPLAHITGRQQFMGMEFLSSADALIPRKETELLGNTAIEILNTIFETQDSATIIDVCTGAGNLAIACAVYHPSLRVYAADLSSEAVTLAKKNVAHHNLQDRVEIREGDLLAPFDDGEFYKSIDLLTCNPPYISSAKVETMHSEISDHEPRLAFDGGPFGIKILTNLIQKAPKYLRDGGWLAFEVGLGQGVSMIKRLSKNDSYMNVRSIEDEQGNTRVVVAQV